MRVELLTLVVLHRVCVCVCAPIMQTLSRYLATVFVPAGLNATWMMVCGCCHAADVRVGCCKSR